MPFGSISEFVCGKCFDDQGLEKYVSGIAERKKSDFCARVEKEQTAAPFDKVAKYIARCICLAAFVWSGTLFVGV
jgi:hypothetical protein